jgi:hypothetical protein
LILACVGSNPAAPAFSPSTAEVGGPHGQFDIDDRSKAPTESGENAPMRGCPLYDDGEIAGWHEYEE